MNEITPQMLPQFETNTIQLLLEICYSYLTQESNQYELECSFPITLRELGMNILDSLILFALNTDFHPENGDIRCASSCIEEFQQIYKRLMSAPFFQVMEGMTNDPIMKTKIRIYRK